MEHEFEKYPELSEMMQEYAVHGRFSDWQKFTDALDKALNQGQSLPIDSVSQQRELLMATLTSRVLTIQSEPDGVVRETMINNLLVDINFTRC